MQVNKPFMDGVILHTGATYCQPCFAFNNEVWTDSSLRFNELETIAGKNILKAKDYSWCRLKTASKIKI